MWLEQGEWAGGVSEVRPNHSMSQRPSVAKSLGAKVLVRLSSSLHVLLIGVSRSVLSDSFATPWTVAHQAPLSMGFSKQGCWSGLPCPPPGDLPDPGIKPASVMSPPLASRFFTRRPPCSKMPGKELISNKVPLPSLLVPSPAAFWPLAVILL